MKKKLIIALALILAATVVFAACKKDGDTDNSTTDPSTTESTTSGEAYTDKDGFCVDEPVEDNSTNKDNTNNTNNNTDKDNNGNNNGGSSIVITPGDPDGPGFVDDGDPIIFGDGNGGQEDSIGWDELG